MGKFKILNSNGNISNEKNVSMTISDYADYFIPILNLYGSLSGMTKDNAVTLNYTYRELSGTCTLKWQGASSIGLPKKNFTVKFDQEFESVSGWGKQKKYCLKANFVDSSHSRNIVCAKLWGQMVKSRVTVNEAINALPNGGSVDGFPIILSINGEFQGIYTWNIPKDDWLLGMDGTGQQAILCAETNNNGAVTFNGLATLTEDSDGLLDFDLEYSSDNQSEWVLASLNRLISAVMNSDGTNIEYGITPYLDWESAIDYYIHAVLTGNYDGIQRNYLLFTHDGVKWSFGAYDMDVVLGLRAMGKYFYDAKTAVDFSTVASTHKVFNLIWKYMRPQLRARYNELRNNVMSVENVANKFVDFIADIPLGVYVDDNRKWNTIPSSSANNIAQIITYYDLRCRNTDKWIADTSGETELPEQINPNIPTLSSISATYTGGNVTEGTALTDLTGIIVKATYSDGTTSNVTGYILNGTIVEGVNTITVTYEGLTTTFTVTGVKAQNYTNQVPISIDTDGSVFNGVGYVGKTRLSSSGVTKADNYISTTGYIPAQSGAIIRVPSDYFTTGSCYVCAYNSNFEFISAVNAEGYYNGGTVEKDGDITKVTLLDNNDIAYIRVSETWTNSDPYFGESADPTQGPCERMIVTVNEEIV